MTQTVSSQPKLNDTQLVILSAAAARDDGALIAHFIAIPDRVDFFGRELPHRQLQIKIPIELDYSDPRTNISSVALRTNLSAPRICRSVAWKLRRRVDDPQMAPGTIKLAPTEYGSYEDGLI